MLLHVSALAAGRLQGVQFYVQNFFFQMPPHVHIDFVVPPPGCGRSVTDF
jgi:hypothetical protein